MSRSPLSGLSDRELLSRLRSLVEKERAATLEVLLHLNEVERRRLYLALGFPSLFEYGVRHLGYSRSAAGRRIAAARCVREYPEVLGYLEKNEMTLVTVSRVAEALTPENWRDLLEKVRGRSDREVEAILSGYRPPLSLGDRVRPVQVVVPASRAQNVSHGKTTSSATPSAGSAAAGSAGGAAGPSLSRSETQPPPQATSHPSPLPPTPTPTPPSSVPATVRLEERFQIRFVATKAFMKKLEKARSLLSNRLEERSFESVFEALMDEFLERHSPENREERRERRVARREECRKKRPEKWQESAGPTLHDEAEGAKREGPAQVGCRKPSDVNRRHIPARIRDAVYQRDGGRCTYVGTAGERCGSTRHLQIDHIVPHGRGGANTVGNLRLLCGKHNRLEAERIYGANAIRRYRPRE